MQEGKRRETGVPSCLDTLAGQTTLRDPAGASLLQERPLLVTGAAACGCRGWRRGLSDGRSVLWRNVDALPRPPTHTPQPRVQQKGTRGIAPAP